MQTKVQHLFRQEALEHLSSPEQLDQAIQVIRPRAWISLSAVGVLVAIAGLWSVFGRIPLIVAGQGILVKPRQVVQFQSSGSGQLAALHIKPGDRIKKGDVIGTIDQSALKQQLQQAQAKLAELESQNQNTTQLQQQLMAQQLENLQQQRRDLENNLQRERTTLELQSQTDTIIADKRTSLELRRQQVRQLLQTLQNQVETRRQLFKEQIVSQDVLTRAEQDYFNVQAQLSDVEVQLKDLDLQKSEAKRSHFNSLNTIDSLQTKIQDLSTQATKLQEQALQQAIDKTNQIQELQREIAQLTLQLANQGRIVSQHDGRVLDISVVPGQVINAGDRLGRINVEDPQAEMISYIYFSNQDGKQIQPRMPVQITPSFAQREQYGGILGTVTEVSAFPITPEDIAVTIGNSDIARTLTADGKALIQVTAQLEKDSSTVSGYRWSSSVGPPLQVSSGTTTSVRVRVGEQAPIAYVLPILRQWTGIGG